MSNLVSAHFAKLNVLVVDDNSYHRAIISEILRTAGVGRIHTASNADEAFEEMRIWQPKAIILDWMMEPVDGRESPAASVAARPAPTAPCRSSCSPPRTPWPTWRPRDAPASTNMS
jgi:AmiR/NasT family two-component response regulator